MKKVVSVAFALLASVSFTGVAMAEYPERPISIIEPWPPGDVDDQLLRVIAEQFTIETGVPAKVVNRHGGGAALLDEPELVGAIVAAVRRAVPAHVPVSAKMRLGFNDDTRAFCSIPARHDLARRMDANFLGGLVARHIIDVHGLSITDPLAMEQEINQWPGVVGVGIFARNKAQVCLLGTANGVQTLNAD